MFGAPRKILTFSPLFFQHWTRMDQTATLANRDYLALKPKKEGRVHVLYSLSPDGIATPLAGVQVCSEYGECFSMMRSDIKVTEGKQSGSVALFDTDGATLTFVITNFIADCGNLKIDILNKDAPQDVRDYEEAGPGINVVNELRSLEASEVRGDQTKGDRKMLVFSTNKVDATTGEVIPDSTVSIRELDSGKCKAKDVQSFFVTVTPNNASPVMQGFFRPENKLAWVLTDRVFLDVRPEDVRIKGESSWGAVRGGGGGGDLTMRMQSAGGFGASRGGDRGGSRGGFVAEQASATRGSSFGGFGRDYWSREPNVLEQASLSRGASSGSDEEDGSAGSDDDRFINCCVPVKGGGGGGAAAAGGGGFGNPRGTGGFGFSASVTPQPSSFGSGQSLGGAGGFGAGMPKGPAFGGSGAFFGAPKGASSPFGSSEPSSGGTFGVAKSAVGGGAAFGAKGVSPSFGGGSQAKGMAMGAGGASAGGFGAPKSTGSSTFQLFGTGGAERRDDNGRLVVREHNKVLPPDDSDRSRSFWRRSPATDYESCMRQLPPAAGTVASDRRLESSVEQQLPPPPAAAAKPFKEVSADLAGDAFVATIKHGDVAKTYHEKTGVDYEHSLRTPTFEIRPAVLPAFRLLDEQGDRPRFGESSAVRRAREKEEIDAAAKFLETQIMAVVTGSTRQIFESDECAICLDEGSEEQPIDALVFTCMHKCMHSACAKECEKSQTGFKKCVVCRGQVRGWLPHASVRALTSE